MSAVTDARYRALLAELQEMGREDLRDALRAAITLNDETATLACLQRVYGHLDAHEDLVQSALMHASAAMDAIRFRGEAQRMVAALADHEREAWGNN